jgi:two-component system sensor histidine kinase BaeS
MATSSPTPDATAGRTEPAWYRSLYWRIALGFVLCLAGIIAAQALVVVWLLARDSTPPGPPPRALARLVARDLSDALENDGALDLERYVRDEYQQRLSPFVLVMLDGRVIASSGATPDGDAIEGARRFAQRAADAGPLPLAGRPDDGPRFGRGRGRGPGRLRGDGPDRLGPALALVNPPAEIVVGGRVIGAVIAQPQTLFSRLGPTLMASGLLLLIAGTALASVLVVAPVRGRLADLEATAARIGAGDLRARAREDGGDEVAALARTVNRMARELDARAAQLAESDRARRLLLADVSHELLTPLTSMRGYLETLGMPAVAADQGTRARYLGVVSDETHRLEQIVGDLLDLARLEGNHAPLDRQDVSIESVFGRIRDRHARDAESRQVRLTTRIAANAEIVQGDPLRLEQAVQNLAANALRHTPPGGEVALECDLDGTTTVITVRDTGEGIAAEHVPHVFERFYKADASRGSAEAGRGGAQASGGGTAAGSGLGLSIVKAIVERHGGTVSVRSTPGSGTTFTLRLP